MSTPVQDTGTALLTTEIAVQAIEWERAPRDDHGGWVNHRVACADGFRVSVQASSRHYANDSTGGAPYWHRDSATAYPFTTFEIGNPSVEMTDADRAGLDEWESGGVWAWVPRTAVLALLDTHGGAVAWEQ